MMRRRWFGLLVLVLVSGCSGVSATQLGHTVGALAGIAVPAASPVTTLVGMLAGMMVDHNIQKAEDNRERRSLSDQLGVGSPGASAAAIGDPVRVWVDETVREGRILSGHFDVRHLP